MQPLPPLPPLRHWSTITLYQARARWHAERQALANDNKAGSTNANRNVADSAGTRASHAGQSAAVTEPVASKPSPSGDAGRIRQPMFEAEDARGANPAVGGMDNTRGGRASASTAAHTGGDGEVETRGRSGRGGRQGRQEATGVDGEGGGRGGRGGGCGRVGGGGDVGGGRFVGVERMKAEVGLSGNGHIDRGGDLRATGGKSAPDHLFREGGREDSSGVAATTGPAIGAGGDARRKSAFGTGNASFVGPINPREAMHAGNGDEEGEEELDEEEYQGGWTGAEEGLKRRLTFGQGNAEGANRGGDGEGVGGCGGGAKVPAATAPFPEAAPAVAPADAPASAVTVGGGRISAEVKEPFRYVARFEILPR